MSVYIVAQNCENKAALPLLRWGKDGKDEICFLVFLETNGLGQRWEQPTAFGCFQVLFAQKVNPLWERWTMVFCFMSNLHSTLRMRQLHGLDERLFQRKFPALGGI